LTGPTIVMCARGPPQVSGSATVMYELLRHFPKDSVVLVTRAQRLGISKDDRVLQVKTYEVGAVTSVTHVPALRLLFLPVLLLGVLRRLRSLSPRPSKILAVHPDLDFLLASIFLSKLLGLPFYAYLHDCITETATHLADRLPSRWAEKFVFARATKVYAMSSPMEKYYKDRGKSAEALPHGVNSELMRSPSEAGCAGKPKIGFAGAVYETNGSAIRDLVDAKALAKNAFEVHVTTSEQSLPFLRRVGAMEGLDSVRTLETHAEVLNFLASCDVLFVPMSFESPNYKDLLTIFPTKVTDYWLAQKPIVVYGPREYAFVPLAEQAGYAKVVSERSPEAIAETVSEVCSDAVLRGTLVSASRRMVTIHDGKRIATRLMADLGISPEGG